MSCFYILEINPLSVASFANIFSHSVCCLFVLFMVFFATQKLLSLIRSHLYICFYFHYSRRLIQKDIAMIYVKVFCLLFAKSFTVSGLTFRSLIHLEFIFVYGVIAQYQKKQTTQSKNGQKT